MLKLLKWIYALGILNERRRVRLLIEEYADRLRKSQQEFDYLRTAPDSERAEVKAAGEKLMIDNRVMEILNKLVQPDYTKSMNKPPIPLANDSINNF